MTQQLVAAFVRHIALDSSLGRNSLIEKGDKKGAHSLPSTEPKIDPPFRSTPALGYSGAAVLQRSKKPDENREGASTHGSPSLKDCGFTPGR